MSQIAPQQLYSADQLLDGFNPWDRMGYVLTHDFSVFRQFVSDGGPMPTSISVRVSQAQHDAGIADALRRFLMFMQRPLVGVMGGHSVRRDASEVERTPRLREIIAAEPLLAPFIDRRLDKNGLTIEGVAVTEDLVLLAGFRGPVLAGNRAVIISVDIATLFGGSGSNHRLFRLPLGEGRGVRDLAIFESNIIILAGPVEDGRGAYAIYAWDGKSENVRRLAELSSFDPKRKPEGLLPLERTASGLRVLILFDGEKEGAPTPLEIEAP